MSQLSLEYNAINLGQGFPDFEMSAALIEEVHKAMTDGFNQYSHMNGLPLLRQRIAEKVAMLYNTTINPETEITVTPGATYAIYTALTTALHAGDEVIVFEPAYDSYIPGIHANGAVPVLISLQYPDYTIPWDEVRSKITPKTKMIMLNTPHNPTGSVLTDDDIQQLHQVTAGTNIMILSDEVYEHLIYNSIAHQSMLRYPELFKRSFVCFSFGKTYSCTGWKVGYCVAPASLTNEYRKLHQFNAFSTNTPVQYAFAKHLQNHEEYLQLGNFIQQKRDFFQQLMQATPFKPLPSHGSYFQCYSYEGLTNLPDQQLAIKLVKEFGVGCIPVSVFYKNATDNHVLRFCFAKKEATLEEAVSRLQRFK